MLEDVVHEKQVGFRMQRIRDGDETFVVPMVVGFWFAKQSFGGSSWPTTDVVGKLLRAPGESKRGKEWIEEEFEQ